jgi:NAD(P)H dehydrogenase (quinone)
VRSGYRDTMAVKISIIYYSATGTVHTMARRAAEIAEKAGAEVRLRHVREIAPEDAIASQDAWSEHRREMEGEPVATPEDLTWADAVLIGTPTRFGSAASQLQAFIDTLGPVWQRGELADKVYAGFVASQTRHGGQETTLLSLYTNIIHWGGIIVAPGYTDELKFVDGNPYGAGKVTGESTELGQSDVAAVDHLTTRVLGVAERLAG